MLKLKFSMNSYTRKVKIKCEHYKVVSVSNPPSRRKVRPDLKSVQSRNHTHCELFVVDITKYVCVVLTSICYHRNNIRHLAVDFLGAKN